MKIIFTLVNPQRACAVRVTVVDPVCVCVSVNQLTSRASVRPENDTTYSTGNDSQKNLWGFL